MIECLFASFRQWMNSSRKPWSMALLRAKHVASGFLAANDRKRRRLGCSEVAARVGEKRKRPAWVFKRGESARRNAWHEFVGARVRQRERGVTVEDAFRDAGQAYASMQSEEREKARRLARRRNAITASLKRHALAVTARPATHVTSLWEISRGDIYPLDRFDVLAILETKAGVVDFARKWKAKAALVQADDTFPTSVTYHRVIRLVEHSLSADKRLRVGGLLQDLKLALAPNGLNNDEFRPLVISDVAKGYACVVLCIGIRKHPTFLGECVAVEPPEHESGVFLQDGKLATMEGKVWRISCDRVFSLSDVAVKFAQEGSALTSYRFADVDYSKIVGKNELWISSFGAALDLSAIREECAARRRTEKAMRMFRRAMNPCDVGTSRRRRVGVRRGQCGVAAAMAQFQCWRRRLSLLMTELSCRTRVSAVSAKARPGARATTSGRQRTAPACLFFGFAF